MTNTFTLSCFKAKEKSVYLSEALKILTSYHGPGYCDYSLQICKQIQLVNKQFSYPQDPNPKSVSHIPFSWVPDTFNPLSTKHLYLDVLSVDIQIKLTRNNFQISVRYLKIKTKPEYTLCQFLECKCSQHGLTNFWQVSRH